MYIWSVVDSFGSLSNVMDQIVLLFFSVLFPLLKYNGYSGEGIWVRHVLPLLMVGWIPRFSFIPILKQNLGIVVR